MTAQFTSIGHSNRDLSDVIDMLREAGIGLVIDVRTFPRSRNNPVYNIECFPHDLARWQIGYRHSPALGGRRPKQPGVEESLNAMWRLQSFHNYADYALGDEFGAAFDELVSLGRNQRIAMMCSEAVWWRCHRRIITDHLLLNGHPVDHLMAPGRTDPATPTPGSVKTAEGQIIYPASKT
ncbi:MAG: DUF488 domain-containing protein [Aurantimonas endophytica]|uniref:DUF488 domain-containing protein n=1 Tax=Aurantimonas endophytica TaxID=1522175 RepID=UPI00300227A6